MVSAEAQLATWLNVQVCLNPCLRHTDAHHKFPQSLVLVGLEAGGTVKQMNVQLLCTLHNLLALAR